MVTGHWPTPRTDRLITIIAPQDGPRPQCPDAEVEGPSAVKRTVAVCAIKITSLVKIITDLCGFRAFFKNLPVSLFDQ